MNNIEIFAVLGIPETKDEAQIKAAYRSRLVSVNPEDDQEGFKALRRAYELALAFANTPDEADEVWSSDMVALSEPVKAYLQRLDAVYNDLPRRLDDREWTVLAQDAILDELDDGETAKWRLFAYLADHFRLPCRIWRILDQAFFIGENAQAFRERMPDGFVDYMLYKINDENGGSDFSYETLSGEADADYDGFLAHYYELRDILAGDGTAEDKLRDGARVLQLLAAYPISHPWYLREKAEYLMLAGQTAEAEAIARELLAEEAIDDKTLVEAADILYRCGHGEEAAAIYQAYLQRETMQTGAVYLAAKNLAGFHLAQGELETARDYAIQAVEIQSDDFVEGLLSDVNTRLIACYTEEKGGVLTEAESDRLGWCYIQTNRAEEGAAFFAAHPEYYADTADCHQLMNRLYMLTDQMEQAASEAALWRQSLLRALAAAEDEDKPALNYRIARSHCLEGRALGKGYVQSEDERDEGQKAAALAALEQALAMYPEDIDFMMHKMLFLRALDEHEQVVGLCERIAAQDSRFYWSYFYMQEAQEKLRNAQAVVDLFYQAKDIYNGHPEIYERTAQVFLDFSQYDDVMDILKQAEEAGVTSGRLKVDKLMALRKLAEDDEAELAADAYAEALIAELEQEGAPDELLADAYMERAFLHDNSDLEALQDPERFIPWVQKAIELDDSANKQYALGRMYHHYRRDVRKAYACYKLCEERGVDYEWLYFNIAQCHEDFREWDQAIAYYKKTAEANPENKDVYWRIGWLYRRKLGRTWQMEYADMALAYINRQIEKFGGDGHDYWQRSDIYAKIMNYEAALADIEQALSMADGDVSRNWGHKGLVLERLGRREEARACYEKGIALDDQKGEDYEYGYSQMYDYFMDNGDMEGGIAYFEQTVRRLHTDEERQDQLRYLWKYNIKLRRWDRVLALLTERYGSIDLTQQADEAVESDRIDNVLYAYSYFLPEDELRQQCQAAEQLLQGRGQLPDVADVYSQLGHIYGDILGDNEKGLHCFQEARLALAQSDSKADSDYRDACRNIMKCLRRLGRQDQAGPYYSDFLESLALQYAECADLGKDTVQLYLSRCGRQRSSLYNLFCLSYFSGDSQQARHYGQQIGGSPWCCFCYEKDCNELWEVNGYLALLDGDEAAARAAFERSNACAVFRNADALGEVKWLERKGQQ